MLSAQNGGESGSLSEEVARAIASVFVGGFGQMSPEDQREILDGMSWYVRKGAHATEYACLAASLVITCWQIRAWYHESRGYPGSLSMRVLFVGISSWAIATLYAGTDELHQLFVSERAGQLADVLVDSSGAVIGSLLCSLVLFAFLRHRTAPR